MAKSGRDLIIGVVVLPPFPGSIDVCIPTHPVLVLIEPLAPIHFHSCWPLIPAQQVRPGGELQPSVFSLVYCGGVDMGVLCDEVMRMNACIRTYVCMCMELDP